MRGWLAIALCLWACGQYPTAASPLADGGHGGDAGAAGDGGAGGGLAGSGGDAGGEPPRPSACDTAVDFERVSSVVNGVYTFSSSLEDAPFADSRSAAPAAATAASG